MATAFRTLLPASGGISHLDSGIDPDTLGSPVLYWYETVRDPKAEGGARLVPHLIDNRSGVGNFVLAVDLKKRPGVTEDGYCDFHALWRLYLLGQAAPEEPSAIETE